MKILATHIQVADDKIISTADIKMDGFDFTGLREMKSFKTVFKNDDGDEAAPIKCVVDEIKEGFLDDNKEFPYLIVYAHRFIENENYK